MHTKSVHLNIHNYIQVNFLRCVVYLHVGVRNGLDFSPAAVLVRVINVPGSAVERRLQMCY